MLAVIFGAVPVIITIVLVAVSWRAATGRLPRNPRAGFRTPTTMRSDQAWVAAHRAALRLTPLYLLTAAVTCAALAAAAVYATTTTVVFFIGIGAAAVLLAVLFYTAYIAGKAAKSVGDQPDDRHR